MHPFAPAIESLPTARRRLRRAGAILCLLAAATSQMACSGLNDKLPSVTSLVTPYKIDILQGNVVTSEQAKALQPGMSRQQVRDMLGSPLLASVFHADRWDYVFTFKRRGQEPQRRKLTVFFKGEALERFESDPLPSEAEFVSSLDVRRSSDKTPVLKATDEQLKAFQERNAAPASASTPVPATAAPAVVYPPLEAGATR
jgi:outer membrane protein assembly factor BamE